ncbi:hypothetical protein CCYA_CCYA17G4263 [Cyanidiococcus yangmingshanensis]|nr:hypothetical protein CCYA_CCYA17G4263 [Cyanidiococcus yangmingshanensis]
MSAAVVQPAVWQVAPGAGAQRQHARVVTVTTVRLPTATTSGPTVGHGTPHIGHRIALWLRRETHLPDWATLMVVSALPVVELRGGVPVGLWLGLSPIFTFFLCVLGNMLPIPFLLWALQNDRVRQWARPLLDSVSRRLPAHSGTRSSQALALALFVGVPLPGTGAWSGAIAAFLLQMDWWLALVSIGVGVVIAGCIMTALVMLGRLGALIVSFVLLGVGASALWRAVRQASS